MINDGILRGKTAFLFLDKKRKKRKAVKNS